MTVEYAAAETPYRTQASLAQRLGIARQQLVRYKKSGVIPEPRASQVAIAMICDMGRLGYTPRIDRTLSTWRCSFHPHVPPILAIDESEAVVKAAQLCLERLEHGASLRYLP